MQGGKQSLALRCRNIGLQLRLVRPDRATDLARHGVAGERHAQAVRTAIDGAALDEFDGCEPRHQRRHVGARDIEHAADFALRDAGIGFDEA